MCVSYSLTVTYSYGAKHQCLPSQSYTFSKCKNKSPVKINQVTQLPIYYEL